MPKKGSHDALLDKARPSSFKVLWSQLDEAQCRELNRTFMVNGAFRPMVLAICRQTVDIKHARIDRTGTPGKISDARAHRRVIKNPLAGDGTLSRGSVNAPAGGQTKRTGGPKKARV